MNFLPAVDYRASNMLMLYLCRFYAKHNHRIFLIPSLVFIYSVFFAVSASAGTIWTADFEKRHFHKSFTTSLCCDHSAQIVNSPVRSGNHAVKFTLNSDDQGVLYKKWRNKVIRAELVRYHIGYVGDSRWYGFSTFVDPSWYDETRDPTNGTVVAQWHTNTDPGEAQKSPYLSISVKGDTWIIGNFSDPQRITTRFPRSFRRKQWNGGQVRKGQWVDWVIYIKSSYRSDGILKIWKDGDLIVNHRGPNTYNDTKPQFFKYGLYKSWWKVEQPQRRNTLIVYYDEIRISNGYASYNDVAPRGRRFD